MDLCVMCSGSEGKKGVRLGSQCPSRLSKARARVKKVWGYRAADLTIKLLTVLLTRELVLTRLDTFVGIKAQAASTQKQNEPSRLA